MKMFKPGIIIFGLILMLTNFSSCNRATDWTTVPTTNEEEREETTGPEISYVLVDTGQDECYDDTGRELSNLGPGSDFYGQDAQYESAAPSYTDNGDGTVTDKNTGLMWQKHPGEKLSWSAAREEASSLQLGGYSDWRLPTIKELYSLIDFRGYVGRTEQDSVPYIDTRYFEFIYGDTSQGERIIDAQYWSSTEYTDTTMGGNITIFGVNFADGRIKGYPRYRPENGGQDNVLFARYVRGNSKYGVNDFKNNGDGTVTDRATGLMWMRVDSGEFGVGKGGSGGLTWEQALAWAEDLEYAGYSDWRLPNAKELQSIVDYSRSPGASGTAAIDPVFKCTPVTDDDGQKNYPYYWTGTTHLDGPPESRGSHAVYVAFGRAMGYMEMPPGSGEYYLVDVHGAGAQRSDPKSGDPGDWPWGNGPQGDVIVIYNHVRCVRDAN